LRLLDDCAIIHVIARHVKEPSRMTILKRQFITDADGKPIGVILPVEEFDLVAETLEQRLTAQQTDARVRQIEAAVRDPLFLADLAETMAAFRHADSEWWEQAA